MKNFHCYHLVQMSPWPILASFGTLCLTCSMISWMVMDGYFMLLVSLLILILVSYQWWRDVVRESTFQGYHSSIVVTGLRYGMILFIVSEVFFFVSFFWAFFHSSLVPNIEVGCLWPPSGITSFNPLQVPLLNTTILLSSGITITWAHHSLLNHKKNITKISLGLTLGLGIYFTILQGWEYMESSFTLSDSIYGSTFFVSTGFHGLHVLIGSTFLLVCFMRTNNFSSKHHFGFEAAAWYWHFVDVVWLFLYSVVYWWGL